MKAVISGIEQHATSREATTHTKSKQHMLKSGNETVLTEYVTVD